MYRNHRKILCQKNREVSGTPSGISIELSVVPSCHLGDTAHKFNNKRNLMDLKLRNGAGRMDSAGGGDITSVQGEKISSRSSS